MDASLFTADILWLLFFISVMAGLLDTLAGGGGLITLPALMLAGASPISALATNKLQGSFGTATSSLMMIKKKQVKWQEIKVPMAYAFVGSFIGTAIVHFINIDSLRFIIPIILVLIAIYFLWLPKSIVTEIPRWSKKKYQRVAVPIVGFYDGMFGPGTGSFFNLTGMALQGFHIIKSTANAKTLNFATNIASLSIYLFTGHLLVVAGLIMIVGQVLGAWIGSLFLLKINPTYLRYLVVIMSLSMLAKFAEQNGWFSSIHFFF